MKRKWALALLIGIVAGGGYAGKVLATPASPTLQTTILAKSTFDPLRLIGNSSPPGLWRVKLKTDGLSDLYVVDNKFSPGDTTGWHSHPGPSLIFVVAGTVTNYDSGDRRCSPHTYTAGSNFVDSGGDDVHMLRNETNDPAETIAVQFLPERATRKIDAPEPRSCHV
jgi:quercetin dioxygenase-like cupin family protein